jgi:two-component system nitrate/nitrite response regulator NarL
MGGRASAFIVSKNSLTREGLNRILPDNGFDIVQAVSDITELQDSVDTAARHIILIDCTLASQHISSDIATLHTRFPDAKIIVLEDEFNFTVLCTAFEAGAHGYILKDVPFLTFVANLRLILLDQKVAPTNLIEMLGSFPNASEPRPATAVGLTDREEEILSRIAIGQPNKIISRELNISESLVKLSLKSIYKKLSVSNRTEAAIAAREKNLVFGLASNLKSAGLAVFCALPPLFLTFISDSVFI